MVLPREYIATTMAPISGLQYHGNSCGCVGVGNDIWLAPIDGLPKSKNWREYFGLGDYNQLSETSLAFIHEYRVTEGPLTLEITRAAQLNILHALLALWIHTRTPATIRHFFDFESKDLGQTPFSYNRLAYSFVDVEGEAIIDIHEFNEDVLTIINNNIGHSFRESLPIRIALWHLFSSRRMPEWETRFVSLCVVLESLFTTGHAEITHQISERIGFFLEETGEAAYLKYKFVKKLYGIRSKIVHGSDLKFKNGETGRDYLAALEDLVQLCLRKILTDKDLFQVFNVRKEKDPFLAKLVFS